MFNFFKKSQKEIEKQKALQDMANFAMQQQMTATQAMQQHKMFMAGSAGSKVGSGAAGSAGGGGGGLAGRTYVAPGHISAGYSPNDLVMVGVPCEGCGYRNDFPVNKKEVYCYLCNAKISINDVTNSYGRPLYNAVHKKTI